MTNREKQLYEEYWSYTAAFTDLNGKHFLSVLKKCIEFFDKQDNNTYTKEKYDNLQKEVTLVININSISVRKSINQLVKLGFLKPNLEGYVPEAVEYINSKTNRKRKNILSKIIYKYSNFNNSITNPDVNGYGQINFFLKTLENIGAVDTRALVAMMAIDINKYPNGYLNKDELDDIFSQVEADGFINRKYNQISHLKNLLGKLDDLVVHDNDIYFKSDALRMFGDIEETKTNVRDPYLQRVYKSELEDESINHYGGNNPKCMLEGLTHPVLIASHIKPYSISNPDEAFDVNNGLLLSKNTDSLFDLGYITFNPDGTIIPSKVLDNDMVKYLSDFRLDKDFINEKRMDYMDYHRNHVFEKRYSTGNVRKYVFSSETTTIITKPSM